MRQASSYVQAICMEFESREQLVFANLSRKCSAKGCISTELASWAPIDGGAA
jgi:hypothetical protein